MSLGITEVITLLLGMSGFGVQNNPKAPSPEASLQYALPDPDLVAHVDAASLVPGNYKLLTQLADQPQIKAIPEIAAVARQAIDEIEGMRGIARTATGIDPAADISDATIAMRITSADKPTFVLAVHGKFSAANIDKIAATSHAAAQKIGGAEMIAGGKDDPAIAVTKDGVLLVGTEALVRERLADAWRAPAHGPGTPLGYAAEVLAQKPVFAVVLTMSPAAKKATVEGIGHAPNFLVDVVKRHRAAAFAVLHDGIAWTWVDSTKQGLDDMELVSQGVLDLLRAAQIAPRGFGKIAMGALDSYKGASKQLDEVLKHKADLMKIIESYTGDGSFKATVDKDPKTLRLTVRATGKSVSDVVPMGLLLPLGAIGFLVEKSAAEEPPQPMIAVPPPPPSTGRTSVPAPINTPKKK